MYRKCSENTGKYCYIKIFEILWSRAGIVLVLHTRLVAPLGPGDGILFPSSCYIYESSYLRGPLGHSMCSENPQQPPSKKASVALWLDITASWLTSYNMCLSVWQTNLLKCVSECLWASPSLLLCLYCCLNACRCLCVAVCFCLCFVLCLRVVVCPSWSDRTRVWQSLSCAYTA